ncbi:MAG: ExbD/TolR family protein [Thermaurantiacus sp.]
MGMSVGGGKGGEPMVDMNTTPLIDVMLVLLIMFIISIPIQTHAVKIDLPPPSDIPSDREPVFNNLEIDFLNQILWNGEQVTFEQLRTNLQQIGRQPVDDQAEVRLRPDAMAEYATVNQVMALAQQAGIAKMGFVGNEAYAG